MENLGFFTSSTAQVSELSVQDFINDSNFEQFIDLIRGEDVNPYAPNYDCELMFGGGNVDSQFCPAPENMFSANCTSTSKPNSILNSLAPFSGDIEQGDEENDGADSSANTTTPTKNRTGDRSRTLMSERRRRSRMKEKLYALRSLVPNITKMDKASIVGDAVSYVQDLQMQATKLKTEISGLEATLSGSKNVQCFVENCKKINNAIEHTHPVRKKVLQMNVFQVEEKEFYVRVVSNKGEGVAVALHKALESLSSFTIESSNFTTVSDRFVLTFTVDVKECGEQINFSTMSLWVTGALVNQGFEIKTP
ncbi:hypothetical protein IFM89_028848 [Coptis chinensis]|uniref:BHLH domain-containing protein n=1 Tax=Coptis chinensis TaxID=261450 RepID=A0A835LNX8_9MAGN|nr:hypothetical protein IFM89_028848 [Coptis chinensis]